MCVCEKKNLTKEIKHPYINVCNIKSGINFIFKFKETIKVIKEKFTMLHVCSKRNIRF